MLRKTGIIILIIYTIIFVLIVVTSLINGLKKDNFDESIMLILVLGFPYFIYLWLKLSRFQASMVLKKLAGYDAETLKRMSFFELTDRHKLWSLDKNNDYTDTPHSQIKLLIKEKRSQRNQKIVSGISEISGAINQMKSDYNRGYNAVDNILGGSSKSTSSSSKAYSDGSISSLREDVKNRKRDLEELRMGIKKENDWEKGMYAKMLADAERRLADAEKINSR